MDSIKRTRHEAKNYSEQRNYQRKRPKITSEKTGRHSAVNALIFDNGSFALKLGYNSDDKPTHMPNCIMKVKSERKRVFVGDQIEDCRDLSGLFYIYPHEKGYITKFDIQKTIWDYAFSKYPIDDNVVMLTQPIFNFSTVQEFTDEVFFEEYDVQYLYKANSTDYGYYNYIKKFKEIDTCTLVVDTGFSFTHIVPYINGKKYPQGIIRMDIGGKLLTNYMKDIVSYRQLHVMEETRVINELKEDVCFMAQNFKAELLKAKTSNDILKHYVMPDFHNIRRGYVAESPSAELAENYQILRLNNERIIVPEVMIRPSIITGFTFAGLAECVGLSLERCPEMFRGELASNVLLCGGNSLFPGFRQRLESEARIYVSCDYDFKVYQPEDAMNYAWHGGKTLSHDPILKKLYVSQHEYEEEGSARLHAKFNQFYRHEEEPPKEEPCTTEEFSYLNFWKNEGVDIFQKGPQSPVKNPDFQFKLEGDNIEEYDGQFVNLDFEIEKPIEEKEDEPPATTTPITEEATHVIRGKRSVIEPSKESQPQTKESTPAQATPIPKLAVMQKLVPIGSLLSSTITSTITTTTATTSKITTLTSIPPKLLNTVNIGGKSRQIVISQQMLQSSGVVLPRPKVLNSNIILPKLTRIQPRIIRPLYKSVQAGTSGVVTSQAGKITQYISLGNSVKLSEAIIVSSSSGSPTKTVVASKSLLGNTVIVPQNMLASKNLTFQIIPIKPNMVSQSNIILTQTQTTSD